MKLKPIAFLFGAVALSASLVAADMAAAASPTTTRRTIKKVGTTQTNLGGGVVVYSTNSGSISTFSWSTGATSGSMR